MIVICLTCGKSFSKFPKDIKKKPNHYCSVECYEKTRERIETKCDECGKNLLKTKAEYDSSEKHFCNGRCSALYNNRHKRIGKKCTKKCRECDNLILSDRTFCKECIKKNKHIHGEVVDPLKTLGYYKSKCKDMNKYRQIRNNAKKITSSWEHKCQKCGYNKHTETCHVRDISDFPDTATMKEINDPNNLVILCRNCHWELDHGIFNIEDIKRN